MFHVVMMFLVSPGDVNWTTDNVALGKPTTQSTTFRRYPSRFAVDGNLNTNMHEYSCSHTEPKVRGGWWQVDLGTVYEIRRVVITNRGDCCGKLHNTP